MRSFLLSVLCLSVCFRTFAQSQVCPLNSNFSLGNLTHWAAYTGNNEGGNGTSAIKVKYDSSSAPPSGTLGAVTIPEYTLSANGIQVITSNYTDPYGNFQSLPTINGYKYSNCVLLGSTNISHSNSGGTAGGYIRGVSYRINVPAGPVTEPYTMTYAYAMVLENGAHNSNQQPLFSATLTTADSIVTCASPQYYLPTRNNANRQGGSATLDTAAAEAEGFTVSSKLSPNANPNSSLPNAAHLQDVWTKSWREVTFDLSPYRGQQVVLTFEADNCVPGGHFAYAYVALRNTCDGLQISGFAQACYENQLVYSVPELTGATYNWTVPNGWTIVSGSDSNILTVKINSLNPGTITVQEVNSCADLKASLAVTSNLPTIPGSVGVDNEVCAGNNVSVLNLSGNRGGVLNWIASTDNGNTWTPISDTTGQYTAQNLETTTIYKAVVQDGASCIIDSSTSSVITVDPRSVGGQLDPSNMVFCLNQFKGALLKDEGSVGAVQNWQVSTDTTNWTPFAPVNTDTTYELSSLTQDMQYRVIVKSGVCPADTSSIAYVQFVDVPFPQATYAPADTTICYGTTAPLYASITIGTSFNWTEISTLTNEGNGTIDGLPYVINATAKPQKTTPYVLSILNAGCPNALLDTFMIRVYPQILVYAGNDTSVVVGEPLQLHAYSSDSGDVFNWTPATDLNNPNIYDPVGVYGDDIDSIRYFVTATNSLGCYGTADILVKVFKTGPDIFVPNAFTPGGPTNTLFRPIPVGITELKFFRVYNRWGQLVYATTAIGKGWDGYLNGKLQDPGTYVWMVQGVTYAGKIVSHKGFMILVR